MSAAEPTELAPVPSGNNLQVPCSLKWNLVNTRRERRYSTKRGKTLRLSASKRSKKTYNLKAAWAAKQVANEAARIQRQIRKAEEERVQAEIEQQRLAKLEAKRKRSRELYAAKKRALAQNKEQSILKDPGLIEISADPTRQIMRTSQTEMAQQQEDDHEAFYEYLRDTPFASSATEDDKYEAFLRATAVAGDQNAKLLLLFNANSKVNTAILSPDENKKAKAAARQRECRARRKRRLEHKKCKSQVNTDIVSPNENQKAKAAARQREYRARLKRRLPEDCGGSVPRELTPQHKAHTIDRLKSNRVFIEEEELFSKVLQYRDLQGPRSEAGPSSDVDITNGEDQLEQDPLSGPILPIEHVPMESVPSGSEGTTCIFIKQETCDQETPEQWAAVRLEEVPIECHNTTPIEIPLKCEAEPMPEEVIPVDLEYDDLRFFQSLAPDLVKLTPELKNVFRIKVKNILKEIAIQS